LARSKLLNRKWHHFFISYQSRDGILLCYHNGKKVAKDEGEGNPIILKDGVLVLGAQQSHYNQVHESKLQFTGEISQLQIYRRTFSHAMIRTFSERCSNIPGNLFRWEDMPTGIKGPIRVRHQSECLRANGGEAN
jgi:hypothetical protein